MPDSVQVAKDKIGNGVASILGYVGAAGGLVIAVVTDAANEQLFGWGPETWMKLAGYAAGLVMLGKYAQATGKVIKTGQYDSTTVGK